MTNPNPLPVDGVSRTNVRDAIAKAIYGCDPYEDPGEAIDGFQVAPAGHRSWEWAVQHDAEFEKYLPSITEWAYTAADAVIAAFPALVSPPAAGGVSEGREWRFDLTSVPRGRDFLIQYDHGEVTIGHYLDNSKTRWPFEGVRPCRSMRPERVTEKIVAWQELPRPTPEGDAPTASILRPLAGREKSAASDALAPAAGQPLRRVEQPNGSVVYTDDKPVDQGDDDMPALCEICGCPMPAGEEMFKFHGYSGPCPQPPMAPPAAEQPVAIKADLLRDLDYLIDDVVADAYVRGAEGRDTETSPQSAKTLHNAIAAVLSAPIPERVNGVVDADRRKTMWAEVVETYEGDGVEWSCQEESGRDADMHSIIIALAANTFPLGTQLEIFEPRDDDDASLTPAKE